MTSNLDGSKSGVTILESPIKPESCRARQSGKLSPRAVVSIDVGNGEQISFDWGAYHEIGTAAYWIEQARQLPASANFCDGNSLLDEVVFCLLGGHGITAEMGHAAFSRLKELGLISTDPLPSKECIEDALLRPLALFNSNRLVRYRFPRKKSQLVHGALDRLGKTVVPNGDIPLRDFLLEIPGIGPKTGSWIVRNYLGSDSVAIIDIHIQRAGISAGFFDEAWKLPKHYFKFEKAFVAYAKIGDVRASVLDACIWEQMRVFGREFVTLAP